MMTPIPNAFHHMTILARMWSMFICCSMQQASRCTVWIHSEKKPTADQQISLPSISCPSTSGRTNLSPQPSDLPLSDPGTRTRTHTHSYHRYQTVNTLISSDSKVQDMKQTPTSMSMNNIGHNWMKADTEIERFQFNHLRNAHL